MIPVPPSSTLFISFQQPRSFITPGPFFLRPFHSNLSPPICIHPPPLINGQLHPLTSYKFTCCAIEEEEGGGGEEEGRLKKTIVRDRARAAQLYNNVIHERGGPHTQINDQDPPKIAGPAIWREVFAATLETWRENQPSPYHGPHSPRKPLFQIPALQKHPSFPTNYKGFYKTPLASAGRPTLPAAAAAAAELPATISSAPICAAAPPARVGFRWRRSGRTPTSRTRPGRAGRRTQRRRRRTRRSSRRTRRRSRRWGRRWRATAPGRIRRVRRMTAAPSWAGTRRRRTTTM